MADAAGQAPRLSKFEGTSGYRVSPFVPYAFLVPAALLFATFSIYPILKAFVWSFTDLSLLAPNQAQWVGLANYRNAIQDEELFGGRYSAAWNTVRFTVWFLPPYVIIPLLLAAMLDSIRTGQVLLRTLLFVPVIISLAVAAVIWVMIYDQKYGIINLGILQFREVLNWFVVKYWALRQFDTEPGLLTFTGPNWLGDRNWAMPALAVMSFWNGMGLNVLLYLVGLNRIDQGLYEAARVDGASPARQFFSITLPLLRPTMYLVLLLSLIGSFRVFGQMYIMTHGGPANTTQSYIMYLYKVAFGRERSCEFGYASAMAFMLAAVIFTLSAVSQRLNKAADQD